MELTRRKKVVRFLLLVNSAEFYCFVKCGEIGSFIDVSETSDNESNAENKDDVTTEKKKKKNRKKKKRPKERELFANGMVVLSK